MKTIAKSTIAAVAALLSLSSLGFANDKVGETPDYNIVRIQPGNGQPVVIYVSKAPTTTIALDVHGASTGSCAGSCAVSSLRLQSRDNGHGQQVFGYVPSSIN